MKTIKRLDEEDIARVLMNYFKVPRDNVNLIWREETVGYGMAEHVQTTFHAEVIVDENQFGF